MGSRPAQSSTRKTSATKSKKAARRRGLPGPTWLLILLGAGIVLALTVWLYFPVARQQYVSAREADRLAAELAAVEARNETIEAEVNRLETPEGIEDYARSQMGWTKPGENAVIVTGIEDPGSSIGIPPRVEAGSIEVTQTVWTRLLDTLFGVK